MPRLAGSIVRLVPLERSHLELWRTWVNDPEIAGYVDRVLPVTVFEHERFFETQVAGNPGAIWFSVVDIASGRHIGNAWLWGIHTRHRHAEIRILIGDRQSWGTGAGTETIALLTDYAFKKIGLHKVYAYVMERNPRARRAFVKAGFTDEAVLQDEAYWDGSFCNVLRLCKIGK